MRLKSIGKIVSNKPMARDCYRMRLKLQPHFKKVTPGQFVHLRLDPLAKYHNEIFLRRPFSVYNIIGKNQRNITTIEILYQIVGKGTELMATLKPGVKIDILGPLGNGFKINHRARVSILVAGGIGTAGLHLLLKRLKDKKLGMGEIYTLIGAKTRKQLYLFDAYQVSSSHQLIATEDGSSGTKGLVTKLLKKLLTTHATNCTAQVYACGPEGMTKEICRLVRAKNIPAQMSLESQMGCGLGICRGCVCKIKDGKTTRYATVCSDGPVFEARQIVAD